MDRITQRIGTTLRVIIIFAMMAGLFTSYLTRPASAAGESVSVWVTTGDQSKLLAQQPGAVFATDSGQNATTIDVDEAVTYQTMDGFGASLTDSSAYDLQQLSATDRENLLQALFNPTTGIGLSFLRQPLGGSDFSVGNYAYDDTCCDVNDFSLNNGHDNAYIIPQLLRIKQINPQVRLMGTPWTPPRWMKTNNDWFGGGDANPARLQTQYYGAYASYMVKYVQAYAAQGLPIDFLTLQNEPYNNNGGMPAMHMDPGEQANFIKNNLGPAFASAGINTKILVWDHNWDVPAYPKAILDDANARQYIAGVAWHCYGGSPDAQTQVRDFYPDKGVWLTECSSGNWVNEGGWGAGTFGSNLYRNVQQLVIRSTRNWSRSVINWNLILDQNNGPTNGSGACFTCYAVARVNTNTKTWYFDVDYYSLGHVSKFVVPGAVRIGSNTFNGGIENVAFKNPDGSKVLVVLNAGSGSSTFKVRWAGQSFSYTLAGGAVATFKWSSCTNCATPTPITRSAYNQIEAENFDLNAGLQSEATTDTGGGLNMGWADAGDYLQFNGVDFGSGAASVQARVASTTNIGRIEFHIDSVTGPLVGTVSIPNTTGWQVWQTQTVPVSGATGVHTLYAVFQGGAGVGNLNWFKFVAGSAPTNTPTVTPSKTPIPPTATATATQITRSAYNQTEAENFDLNAGLQSEATTDTGGGLNMGWADAGDYLQFNSVDFGSGAASVQARVASTTNIGRIEFHIDSVTGPLVGTVNIPNTTGWQVWQTQTVPVSGATGIHTLYVVFQGGAGVGNLNWFKFATGSAPTNTPTVTPSKTPVPPTATAIVPTNTPTTAPATYYRIVNRLSGKALDVLNNSTANGARIQQWAYGGGLNQQWQIVSLGNGYVRIVVRSTGKALDVVDNSTANGAQLQQWDYTGGLNQQWQVVDLGNGYFKIICRSTGKALDDTNQSLADGTLMQVWDYGGGTNQQWSLVAVP